MEEIKQNQLIGKKYKKIYSEHLLISASAVTECVSISTFTSSVGIPVSIASSAATIKISTITAGIKKYKSIIKKKKKKHDKIVLLANSWIPLRF